MFVSCRSGGNQKTRPVGNATLCPKPLTSVRPWAPVCWGTGAFVAHLEVPVGAALDRGVRSEAGQVCSEAAILPPCDPLLSEAGAHGRAGCSGGDAGACPALWEQVTCAVTVRACARPTETLGLGGSAGLDHVPVMCEEGPRPLVEGSFSAPRSLGRACQGITGGGGSCRVTWACLSCPGAAAHEPPAPECCHGDEGGLPEAPGEDFPQDLHPAA